MNTEARQAITDMLKAAKISIHNITPHDKNMLKVEFCVAINGDDNNAHYFPGFVQADWVPLHDLNITERICDIAWHDAQDTIIPWMYRATILASIQPSIGTLYTPRVCCCCFNCCNRRCCLCLLLLLVIVHCNLKQGASLRSLEAKLLYPSRAIQECVYTKLRETRNFT